MNRFLPLCLAALALVGCKVMPFSPFVSPRVTGRVLAADTSRPLADVTVKSGQNAGDLSSAVPPRGGELLMARAPVRTDGNGRFTLATERVLTPFRGTAWFTVQLLFERAGYKRFQTNYSRLNLSTNAPEGAPLLDAGDILLHPAAK